MSYGYRDNLLSGFMELSSEAQEEFFALCCFEPAHWEESISWDVNLDEVDDRIVNYVEEMLSSGQVRSLYDQDQMNGILNSCYHGDMVNRLLCKFLSDDLGLSCRPESNNSRSEFDVTIERDRLPICEIGIKRTASSSQMLNNFQSHRSKNQQNGDGDYSLLVTYFPVTDAADSRRAQDFLKGFDYISPHVDPFYENDENMLLNVPAPLDSTEDDIQPLRTTRDALRQHFDLGR